MIGFIKSKLGLNILSNYAIYLGNFIIPLVSLPYLSRVLSPEKLGLGFYVQSFASFFLVLLDYGFNITATRNIAQKRDDKEGIEKIVSSTMQSKICLLTIGCVLAFLAIAILPNSKKDLHATLVALGNVAILGLFPTWYYQGTEDLKRYSIVILLSKFMQLILIFLFVKSVDSLYNWLVIISFCNFLALLVVWCDILLIKQLNINFKISSNSLLILKDEFGIFVSQAFTTLFTSSNIFVLGFTTNFEQAGIFGAAERLIRAIFSIFIPAIQVISPRISSSVVSGRLTVAGVMRGFGTPILTTALFVSLFVFLSSDFLVSFLYGDNFKESKLIVTLLSPLIFLFAVTLFVSNCILIPFKLDKIFSNIYIFAGILGMILSPLLSLYWGAIGISVSIMLIELLIAVFGLTIIHKTRSTFREE
jgi:polysaccharide transporter, PST family